jgi:hypothetical protein
MNGIQYSSFADVRVDIQENSPYNHRQNYQYQNEAHHSRHQSSTDQKLGQNEEDQYQTEQYQNEQYQNDYFQDEVTAVMQRDTRQFVNPQLALFERGRRRLEKKV